MAVAAILDFGKIGITSPKIEGFGLIFVRKSLIKEQCTKPQFIR